MNRRGSRRPANARRRTCGGWRKRFLLAEANGAKAVVIGIQADMWDPAQVTPTANNLDGYDQFVQALAALALHFKNPVLLLNGDSHLFETDHPLSAAYYATGALHDNHHACRLPCRKPHAHHGAGIDQRAARVAALVRSIRSRRESSAGRTSSTAPVIPACSERRDLTRSMTRRRAGIIERDRARACGRSCRQRRSSGSHPPLDTARPFARPSLR